MPQVLNGSRSTRTEEGVLASAAVRMAYKRMCGSSNEEATVEAAAPVSGRPVEGDCPICYDDLIPGGTDLKVSKCLLLFQQEQADKSRPKSDGLYKYLRI